MDFVEILRDMFVYEYFVFILYFIEEVGRFFIIIIIMIIIDLQYSF